MCANAMSPWFTSNSSTIRPSRFIENIAAPLRIRGLAASDIDFEVTKIAKLLHIEKFVGSPASGAFRRAATALCDRQSLGQEQLAGVVGRAFGQSRLQIARGIARRACANCSEPVRRLWFIPPPNRSKRLTMGGEVIVMDKGRVLQVGPSKRCLSSPWIDQCRQGFFRSADEHDRG